VVDGTPATSQNKPTGNNGGLAPYQSYGSQTRQQPGRELTLSNLPNSNNKLDLSQFITGPSSMVLSPALPSTSGTQGRFTPSEDVLRRREARQSQHSAKTTKSYVSSFISRMSAVASNQSAMIKNALHWRSVKPLPPLPRLPHLSLAAEAERKRIEERLPTPLLVNRADALEKMLEKGDYPHDKLDANGKELIGTEGFYRNDELEMVSPPAGNPVSQFPRDRESTKKRIFPMRDALNPSNVLAGMSKTKRIIAAVCLLVVLLAAIGVLIGVTVSNKRKSSPSVCSGNFTGADCNIGESSCRCLMQSLIQSAVQTRLAYVHPPCPVNVANLRMD
jgi:hypothetical protein